MFWGFMGSILCRLEFEFDVEHGAKTMDDKDQGSFNLKSDLR